MKNGVIQPLVVVSDLAIQQLLRNYRNFHN